MTWDSFFAGLSFGLVAMAATMSKPFQGNVYDGIIIGGLVAGGVVNTIAAITKK